MKCNSYFVEVASNTIAITMTKNIRLSIKVSSNTFGSPFPIPICSRQVILIDPVSKVLSDSLMLDNNTEDPNMSFSVRSRDRYPTYCNISFCN
jgi:hypothetical protein